MPLSAEVLTALGLDGQEVTPIAQRENQVYRVGDSALRAHRPGYRSRSQIEAELAFMKTLADAGLPVPRPGKIAEVQGQIYSTVSWLEGQTLASLVTPEPLVFEQLGEVLKAAQEIKMPALDRPVWDVEAILGEQPLWGRWQDHTDLRASQLSLFTTLKAPGPLPDLKLIHADALRENVMLVNGRVHLIDFDDCAYAYPSFDLATVLVKEWGEPDFEAKKTALLRGYGAVDPQELAFMMALRALTYVGWVKDRLGEPGIATRSDRVIQRAEHFARLYQEGRYGQAA